MLLRTSILISKNVITFTAMAQEKGHILFDDIRNGDEVAFNKAFDLYYSRLCFFADKILHDFDLSRSIAQQVFVDLWIKREKLRIDSLQSYLYQSVRNAALDVLKHKKAESKYLSSLEKEESGQLTDLIEEAELADRINRAIQKLPEKCREIFVLCRFEELKYAEIAEKLNISVKTVEMQIGIALKKLRKELSDYQMIQLLTFIFSKKLQVRYRVN
ncbi:MAG: RNA polymerase sigma-70 factor [Bacteroidota bacterium]|nr:RNA polymerase sigma-70 factor [Bacteroidota bacterium]